MIEYVFLTASDRRYKRNVDKFRETIQKFINDRRAQKTKGDDLLTILVTTPEYNNDDESIKDEIFGFFMAGMKTIQISTTNMIYQLTKNPEIKAKLMKEILPAVEEVQDNIIEKLSYDTVMEFEYM